MEGGGSGSIKSCSSLLKKLDASDISATQLRARSAARRGQWCARVQCLQSSANSGLRDSKFEIRAHDGILLRFGSRSTKRVLPFEGPFDRFRLKVYNWKITKQSNERRSKKTLQICMPVVMNISPTSCDTIRVHISRNIITRSYQVFTLLIMPNSIQIWTLTSTVAN